MTNELVSPAPEFSDTVTAEIPLIDLRVLIQPVKEAQFAEHGKVEDWNYDEDMAALDSGEPHLLLQESRLAREIVRAILSSEARPTRIEGEGSNI